MEVFNLEPSQPEAIVCQGSMYLLFVNVLYYFSIKITQQISHLLTVPIDNGLPQWDVHPFIIGSLQRWKITNEYKILKILFSLDKWPPPVMTLKCSAAQHNGNQL